jgi:hypothetical protein
MRQWYGRPAATGPGATATISAVTNATTPVLTETDDDQGGPAHPTPGYQPPKPEPEPEPNRDEDDRGGPAHPAPGFQPPAESPQTDS